MIKSDEVKMKNQRKSQKVNVSKCVATSEKQKKKIKELEYILQCASAECGW